jgi:hypothetical protein
MELHVIIGTGRQQPPGSASINLNYTRLVLEWTKWNNS